MATQAQMDRLVGKALFDAEFRELLITDPEMAARKLRYRLDGNQAARYPRSYARGLGAACCWIRASYRSRPTQARDQLLVRVSHQSASRDRRGSPCWRLLN